MVIGTGKTISLADLRVHLFRLFSKDKSKGHWSSKGVKDIMDKSIGHQSLKCSKAKKVKSIGPRCPKGFKDIKDKSILVH